MKFLRDNPVIALSLALHLIVPFFSYGFFNPDEQYYTIEFMMLKMGTLDQLTFPWEYNAQIRPFSLPFFFYTIASFLRLLGIEDVFTISTVIRVISSLVGFLSTFLFLKAWKKKYPIDKYLEWVLYLAWPIILMHARTNSENWSTSFFFLGISLILGGRKNLLSGIILGLSFFFRFQLGFLILPVYWFLRKDFKGLGLVTLGIFISCVLMVVVDFWGYGEWTLTPYNYILVNLIQDKVSEFGVSPWWFYFYQGLVKLLPFWGLVIIGSMFWGFKSRSKEFKEILIWILPFLMVHILIGHKELRFIYPILPFCMILAARFIGELKVSWQKVLIWGNILALPILFIPQHKRIVHLKYLYKNSDIKTVYFTHGGRPFHEKSLIRKDLNILPFREYMGERFFYALTPNHKDFRDLSKKFACKIEIEIYPEWIQKFNIGGWVERSSSLVLGYCQNKKS